MMTNHYTTQTTPQSQPQTQTPGGGKGDAIPLALTNKVHVEIFHI